MNDKIEVLLNVQANVIIKLHSYKDGHEEEMDHSMFAGVVERNGKTFVSYFTDNEDCPTDGFYVKESVEEVRDLFREADKEYWNAVKNYTVVPREENICEQEEIPYTREEIQAMSKTIQQLRQENKELKKIGQKSWSEEDDTYMSDAMWCIEKVKKMAKDENDMGTIWFAERWLKSIKQRMKEE